MKNRLFRLLPAVILISPLFLFGQNETAFSLIAKSGAETTNETFTSGEAYEKVLKIYNDLIEARGDWRFDPPRLTMSNNEANVAYLEGDGLSIGMEKKAYEVCMSLGEKEGTNAIAALMGHELIHFYDKHQWRSGFADTYADLKIGRSLQNSDILDKVNNETQADYLGGFLAYSAGYGVFEKLPDFYDKIYKAYDLKDTMRGYADLADRKALATKSSEKLQDLVEVFEMANLMTAIGQFDLARAFYKHILVNYQGREIYNNLGALSIMLALKYFTKPEMKYRMPIELDFSFGASRDGFSVRQKARIDLLNEAIRYLNSATAMDPSYAPGYLNMACAYFLLGGKENIERAKFFAGLEAKERANNDPKKRYAKIAIHADVLLAIIEDASGQTNKAKEILNPIKDKSSIANHNLIVINNGTLPRGRRGDSPEDEEIDGMEIDAVFTFVRNNRRQRKEQELFGRIDFRAWENMGDLKKSKIYVCKPPSGEGPDVYIHLTKPGYDGETLDGFKIGEVKLKEIEDEYDPPSFRWGMPNGEIAVYDEILFITNSEGVITRMATFGTK